VGKASTVRERPVDIETMCGRLISKLCSGLSQHGPVASLGKPYVYEYTGNNSTQLLDAVEQAVSNPIEP
jgi:hypothetical protein